MNYLANKEEIRNFYIKSKNFEPPEEILEFLKENSKKQLNILNNFDISKIKVCLYDLPFKLHDFINCITTMFFKGRVGRKIYLLVKYDDIVLGIFSYSSPSINRPIKIYIENKFKKFDYNVFNDEIVELSVCLGTGILTKYLIGKLICLIAMSKDYISLYNNRYNINVSGLMVTSLYGKSSLYNRLDNLKWLGLSEGSPMIISNNLKNEILEKYKKVFPKRKIKISAQGIHINRLCEHLIKRKVTFSEPIYIVRKGVYICDKFKKFEENTYYWFYRWFLPRKNRIDKGLV